MGCPDGVVKLLKVIFNELVALGMFTGGSLVHS
jgi:hypothetical protein